MSNTVTFNVMEIGSEQDLKDLAPDFDYKLFKKDESGKPVSYVVYGTNCRALVAYHHQTQEPLYDTFDKMFCFVDDNQTENPLAYVIRDGKVYGALTYYYCMFNQNDFTTNFIHDNPLFDLSNDLREIPQELATEVIKIFNEHIIGALNSVIIDVLSKTVFDYCSIYNFLLDENAVHERRLSFIERWPYFIDFYHLFTDKYMMFTPVKLSSDYEPLNESLTPEKRAYNENFEFKFSEVEEGIDNGASDIQLIDIILNNPKDKCVTREEYLPKDGIYVNVNESGMLEKLDALFKDNIFNITPRNYLEKSKTYQYFKILEGFKPEHYHIFEGEGEDAFKVMNALKSFAEFVNSILPNDEAIDIIQFLSHRSTGYIPKLDSNTIHEMTVLLHQSLNKNENN